MNNHRQFYAITNALGLDNEARKALVHQFSNGATESLRDMSPAAYSNMLINLRSQQSKDSATRAESDKWRKRCIAAISAWLDKTGCKPTDRIQYIKATACKIADKEGASFSSLSVSQLRQVYNSFCRQNEAAERASQLKQTINPNPN